MSEGAPVLVLTNDDGIEAPGILALEEAVRGLGIASYCVVAPSGPRSGCGHQVTTHEPISFSQDGEGRYAVSGTPADCVRLALHHLAPGARLILSGVNAGGNLGTDVFHSGTVAAVREGVLHGTAGIALSHYIARGRAIDWDFAVAMARRSIEVLLQSPWAPGTFWNVNFPHPPSPDDEPELIFCPVDPSPLPLDFRIEADNATYSGDYQRRPRIARTDVSACFGGAIAVSSLTAVDPALVAEAPPLSSLLDLLNPDLDWKAPRFRLAEDPSIVP